MTLVQSRCYPKFTTSPRWLQLRSSQVQFWRFIPPHAPSYLPDDVSYFFYSHDAKWSIWLSPGHSVTVIDALTELSVM